MGFLARTVITAIAFWIASSLVAGVHFEGVVTLVVAAIIFGLVNAFIRPIVLGLSLPLNILTLGLFTLVVNAAMLGLTALLIPGRQIEGFGAAFLGAIVIWIVSWIANKVIGDHTPVTAPR